MGWDRITTNLFKRGAIVLALMALAMRVAVPSGFMLAATPDHGLPQLVICTGHGPLLLGADRHGPADAPQKQDASHTCVFAAGHAPGPPPERLTTLQPASAGSDIVLVSSLADQRPGLGLAAPPPPSQGPPPSLI